MTVGFGYYKKEIEPTPKGTKVEINGYYSTGKIIVTIGSCCMDIDKEYICIKEEDLHWFSNIR